MAKFLLLVCVCVLNLDTRQAENSRAKGNAGAEWSNRLMLPLTSIHNLEIGSNSNFLIDFWNHFQIVKPPRSNLPIQCICCTGRPPKKGLQFCAGFFGRVRDSQRELRGRELMGSHGKNPLLPKYRKIPK